MIRGIVTASEAVIGLTVRAPNGPTRKVDAVVDTGFDGWFTLPPDTIAGLHLPWARRGLAVLADGTEIQYDVDLATVVWDKKPRRVEVDEADTAPLVGMAMLEGYELNVQVRPRGKVTIKPLPAGRTSKRPRR